MNPRPGDLVVLSSQDAKLTVVSAESGRSTQRNDTRPWGMKASDKERVKRRLQEMQVARSCSVYAVIAATAQRSLLLQGGELRLLLVDNDCLIPADALAL